MYARPIGTLPRSALEEIVVSVRALLFWDAHAQRWDPHKQIDPESLRQRVIEALREHGLTPEIES